MTNQARTAGVLRTEGVNRVPHVIVAYWIIKIASTTLGETGADMFSMSMGLGYGSSIVLFLAIFLGLLIVKVRLARYSPLSYWSVFTASAILGTVLSDFIDRSLGLGYTIGAATLLGLLLITLAVWKRKEGSLSVEYIETAPAELFYWWAFLIANTLGTAAGDFLADELGMGFLLSAAIIGALLAVTALAYYFTDTSRIFLFWVAFVLTRPFGATFGDLLTKPLSQNGLNLGTYGASAFFAALMAIALWREIRVEIARRQAIESRRDA